MARTLSLDNLISLRIVSGMLCTYSMNSHVKGSVGAPRLIHLASCMCSVISGTKQNKWPIVVDFVQALLATISNLQLICEGMNKPFSFTVDV